MEMDQLNSLSNDELRQRLRNYGFPNLPITSTTRKVLIKKLRNHMNSEQAKLKQATSFVTRYSSDEDTSDQDTKRKQRSTMPPPKTTNKIFTSNSPTITKISPRCASIYISPVVQHLHTDSEDDLDNTTNNSNLSFSNSYGISSKSHNYSIESRSASPNYAKNSQNVFSGYERSNHAGISPVRKAASNGYNNDLPSSNDHSQRFSSLYGRSALSTPSPSRRRTMQTSRFPIGDQPTSSSSLSRKRYPSEAIGAVSLNDSENIHRPDRQTVEYSVPIGKTLSHFFTKLNEQFSIILSLFVAFFAIVAFMYISISPDLASTVNVQDTVYSSCSYDNQDSDGVYCIRTDELNSTLGLLKLTATELQKRMELNRCKDSGIPSTMSAKEVVQNAMQKSTNYPLAALIKDLHNMEYLIKMNPQWNIGNCDATGYNLSFDDVIVLRQTQSNCFVLLKPRLPFMCSLYNKMGTFFTIIGWIALIFGSAFFIYCVYRNIMDVIQSNRDKKNLLINEIITAVMEKAEDDPANPLVVVNHLRDKLLSSQSRSNLEKAWDQAIDYLENNDSRIKFEIGCRNGEDCRLIKWVDTAASTGSKRAFAKKWQCSAYDKLNKIKDPPTQCLKIRQMFEKHEVNNPNLKQIIQDALLEKVGSKCKIHDIELDLNTCCVYVRCASTSDAGMVHDLANGWWFDSRLVSIKFLHIERFLSRFPHSTGVGFLKPSNSNNLSMSLYAEESRVRSQGTADED